MTIAAEGLTSVRNRIHIRKSSKLPLSPAKPHTHRPYGMASDPEEAGLFNQGRIIMKRILISASLLAITAALCAPAGAANVGVSVSVGQPGFYGRLDIGGYPQPPLVYGQPVMVERVAAERPPIYLRVPPGHARHWRKHCREYNACGERVLFVQDNWYTREYAPQYQERHREQREEHQRRDERRDERRDGHRDEHERRGERGDHRER